MNGILDLLTDYTFLMIALGSGLLGLLSGIMGVYGYSEKTRTYL